MTRQSKSSVADETRRQQLQAADPALSAWVSANAGTGKTFVLSRRVVRLLLADVAPERILCLTFTKAAAAEMSQRVFAMLARWVTAPADELVDELSDVLGRAPSEGEMLLARRLFARAIETPGGLKVQTIHAFSERLLKRFPIEAGVAPHFTILDDATQAELRRESIDEMLDAATGEGADPALAAALRSTIAYAAEDQFDVILKQALEKDGSFLLAGREFGLGSDTDAELRKRLGVRPDTRVDDIDAEMAAVIAEDLFPILSTALRAGSKSDVDRAAQIEMAMTAPTQSQRVSALSGLFLTNNGGARKSLTTKAVSGARPDLAERLERAQERFVALDAERKALAVVEASLGLYVLTADTLRRYEMHKAARGALDFSDLIRRAAGLLNESDSASWVLYKLDGGIEHILVDEAQDTSLLQWQIVERLAEEFFSGEGAREAARTLFAVGDEKQSIYSFQGAAPKVFAAKGEAFAERAGAASRRFFKVPLTRSFRSTAAVLGSVDRVFSGEGRPAGVTSSDDDVRHAVHRLGQAGLVEIWETMTPDEDVPVDVWQPSDADTAVPPAVKLARRIAATIRNWLDQGEELRSQGRPITPGDILILVRKRNPFATPVIRALKAAGVPVAGADRIRIAEELAVMDLMALGDFILMPEDDLALATVLKSPICGLDDDDLYRLAQTRRGSLWHALNAASKVDTRLAAVVAELTTWRKRADFWPPYEFLSDLLDGERSGASVRARILSRLGPEANDGLDELLNRALHYDEQQTPSLQGFLGWMRTGGAEIKRDMEQGADAVRIMTVHGAKGLEAPIVFLADTCTVERGGGAAGVLDLESGASDASEPSQFVWPVKGTSGVEAVSCAKKAQGSLDREEYYRLLYVAMTRARDRLYIAGFEGKKGRQAGCWYDVIKDQLGAELVPSQISNGETVWRFETPQTVAVEPAKTKVPASGTTLALPDWAGRKAPAETVRAIPVAPSRLAPLEGEGEEPNEPQPPTFPEGAAVPPAGLVGEDRFRRGELTHLLLEYLPGLPKTKRLQTADELLRVRAAGLSAAARKSIAREVIAVLEDPRFAIVFSAGSRAEVPIVGELRSPSGRGALIRVAGQIDRLIVTDDEVVIVDFKSNRQPPHDVTAVPDAYALQLAAYRLVLQAVYPKRRVRAGLLWTDGPKLMELPGEMLDARQAKLWDLPSTGS